MQAGDVRGEGLCCSQGVGVLYCGGRIVGGLCCGLCMRLFVFALSRITHSDGSSFSRHDSLDLRFAST
jgi:hypothetical protein